MARRATMAALEHYIRTTRAEIQVTEKRIEGERSKPNGGLTPILERNLDASRRWLAKNEAEYAERSSKARRAPRRSNGQYENWVPCDLCGKPVDPDSYWSYRVDQSSDEDGIHIAWNDAAINLHEKCSAKLEKLNSPNAAWIALGNTLPEGAAR